MKQELLNSLSFYHQLSREERKLLEMNGRMERFEAGDLIYSPAKECLGMLVIGSGVVRTCLVSEEGKKAVVFRLREKEVCVLSMSCLIPAITFDVEIEAEEACEVMVIPTVVLQQISGENPYVESFVYRTAVERFSGMVEAVQQLLFMTLEQRIAVFLLDETGARGTEVLQITQEQLAANIGSAREAVTRVLNSLRKKGLIEAERGRIRVLDRSRLYSIVG